MSTLKYPLWGKAGGEQEDGNTRHNALLAHMLAVAACFRTLIEEPIFGKRLSSALGRPLTASDRTLLVWLAALHDIGKVDHRFQRKRADVRSELMNCQASPYKGTYYHGEQGFLCYGDEVFAALGIDRKFRKTSEFQMLGGLLNAACGHHGYYVNMVNRLCTEEADHGYARLISADLLTALQAVLGPVEQESGGRPRVLLPEPLRRVSFIHLFAGLVALADWVGSDEEVFPFLPCVGLEEKYPGTAGLAELFEEYSHTAEARFRDLGIFGRAIPQDILANAVSVLLRDDWRPHPVQAWVIERFRPQAGPNLLLIEAPMGDGKTEAALFAAAPAIDAGLAQGLVFALPTQASANQNHSRLESIGREWFRYRTALLHGKAGLLGKVKDALAGHKRRAADDQGEAGLHFSEWVADSNKRAFLHPVCAATVDQLELGALNSRHNFVRAAALARHVVIIDEIHAYDAYMTVILDSLLHYLGAVAAPVVLLSATLPPVARRRLVGAYARGAGLALPDNALSSADYPLITQLTDRGVQQIEKDEFSVAPDPTLDSRPDLGLKIFLSETGAENDAIAKARDGGCVCIVCNTVKSAQARYERIVELTGDEIEVRLFHARYRFGDRAEIEKDVIGRFGWTSDKNRRAKKILIGTQVVEQSLDLDFDYLITEIAPIDLVLQRAGRMHRHRHHDPIRPASCRQPVLGVIAGDLNDPPEWLQGTLAVYEETWIALERTLEWLQTHAGILMPAGIAGAVREVYGDARLQSELAQRREYRAGGRTLKHDPADLRLPTAGQEHSSATRDSLENASILLVLHDGFCDEESDSIPVWNAANQIWAREELPPASTPAYPINPEFLSVASYWSLALQKNAREWQLLHDSRVETNPLTGISLVDCRSNGQELEIGARMRYSFERGLYAVE